MPLPVGTPGVSSLAATASSRLRPGRALVPVSGDAADALWLAGRGWQVTAVSADVVTVSRIAAQAALFDAPVKAITADLLDYRPEPAGYRLILVGELELAWPQLRRLLTRLVPGLAPDGHLAVLGPDTRNLEVGFGGPANPELLTSSDQVVDLLTGLELQVIRSEVVRREAAVEGGLRYALDHLIEAVRLP